MKPWSGALCVSIVLAAAYLTAPAQANPPILATPRTDVVSCAEKSKAHIEPEPVPAAISDNPELLEKILKKRNPNYNKIHTDAKGREFSDYRGIASLYKKWCGRYGVRFDLAFAQMLHETNYLRFTGSVPPSSFNFAGINAPSSTSAGEQYPGIEHGVKAHCQHLATYALINVTGASSPWSPQSVCGNIGDPLAQLENGSCYESPYTERVRRTTIWPRVCKALGRPATFGDLGPSDNACLSPVDESGRCCDVRADDGKCLGDWVAWARGDRGEGYGEKIAVIFDTMLAEAGVATPVSLSGAYICLAHCPAGGAGKEARIEQNGNVLTFINEGGNRSSGYFEAQTVVASEWGNLRATIQNNGRELHWSNGTIWQRQ